MIDFSVLFRLMVEARMVELLNEFIWWAGVFSLSSTTVVIIWSLAVPKPKPPSKDSAVERWRRPLPNGTRDPEGKLIELGPVHGLTEEQANEWNEEIERWYQDAEENPLPPNGR